ncbi:FliM/FliN family flagellar motor switch protein, partial [bacterium]
GGPPPAAAKADRRAVGLTADVPVQLVAVMGKKTITIKEILSLKKGQVIELNRFPNEAIDLVANGKLMAKGELVEIDGKLGVRIIKIFE